MPEILLATLNAKYIHCAFGLRYLMANLGDLKPRAAIQEFDINQRPLEIVESILAANPTIVGLGVYIWNAKPTSEVCSLLKRLRPELVIVLGGPEISYETEDQDIFHSADYVITGEADVAFGELCRKILAQQSPPDKIIRAALPDFSQLELPYSHYTADDVAHRIIYVEASRGCPFSCEFCLSSLDIPVRSLPLDRLLPAMDELLQRGVQHFKFVDRTFNLNLNTSRGILEFFLDRMRPGLFLHFEMIPDRLPDGLREIIAQFPPGSLQFEVGIQTFDHATGQNISRRQNYERLAANFQYLREHTGVHIHADLIVGLPGEDIASFGRGFDQLVKMRPQEIQVGILKLLRGTPIARHSRAFGMKYSPQPPYEILENDLIPFSEMQRMRRFAKYWDTIANSGNFLDSTQLILRTQASPFQAFLAFSDWLHGRLGRTDSIALQTLVAEIFEFLTATHGLAAAMVAPTLWQDYTRGGRSEKPPRFLRPYLEPAATGTTTPAPRQHAGQRQQRFTS